MKTHIGFVWLLMLLLALPVGAVAASGDALPVPLTVGAADGGHGDEEDAADDVVDDHNDTASTWASLIPLVAGIGVATIASGTSWGLFKHELTNTQLGIMALALVTGTLHLMLGLSGDWLLLLNGIGYLGLLGLLLLPIGLPRGLKKLLRIGLMIYTIITIAGYFYLHSPAQFDTLAIVSKLVEVVLVIVLAMRIAEVQNAEG